MQKDKSPVPTHLGSQSATDWDVFELAIQIDFL